jgi:hypothetical protein
MVSALFALFGIPITSLATSTIVNNFLYPSWFGLLSSEKKLSQNDKFTLRVVKYLLSENSRNEIKFNRVEYLVLMLTLHDVVDQEVLRRVHNQFEKLDRGSTGSVSILDLIRSSLLRHRDD